MSNEYLYRKDPKTGFWKCVQGEKDVINAYSLHLLLTHAAHAQKEKHSMCLLVFGEEEEEAKP